MHIVFLFVKIYLRNLKKHTFFLKLHDLTDLKHLFKEKLKFFCSQTFMIQILNTFALLVSNSLHIQYLLHSLIFQKLKAKSFCSNLIRGKKKSFQLYVFFLFQKYSSGTEVSIDFLHMKKIHVSSQLEVSFFN
jgi:hypothetical protein